MNFIQSLFKGIFAEEFSSLQKKIESKQDIINEKETTIKELINSQKRLSSEMNLYKNKIKNLNKSEQTLQKTIELKNTALSIKKQRIYELELTLRELDNENKDLTKSQKKFDALISIYQENITNLNQELNILKKTLSEKDCEIDNNNKKIHTLQFDLNNTQLSNNSLVNETVNYRQQIENLCLEIEERDRITEDLKQELEEKLIRSKEIEVDLIESQNHIEGLFTQKDSLEAKLQELSHIINDNHSLIAEKDNIILNQKETLHQKDSELTQLNDSITSLRQEITKLTESISYLQTTNESLTADKRVLEIDKQLSDILLEEKDKEYNNMKLELESLQYELQHAYVRIDESINLNSALKQAEERICELENTVRNAPSADELAEKNIIITELELKIRKYKDMLTETKTNVPSAEPSPHTKNSTKNELQQHSSSIKLRDQNFPSRKKTTDKSSAIISVDFPVIENDNIYSDTARTIEKVFNHRTNSYLFAKQLFRQKSVEEISRIRIDLEESLRNGQPYMTCPSCRGMVKISSRSLFNGKRNIEIQYFTHAIKNAQCDLKRNNFTFNTEEANTSESDTLSVRRLRTLLANSLKMEFSRFKGISDVEECVHIKSEELPIMKRRLADVTARYKEINLIFQLVTPNTNIAHVHDRDIFHFVNHSHILWVFGLESIDNYEELKRSVAKDILFTNKRNVFVFDIEAQEASERCGELILKCNWLDADNTWHYQINRDGKNGILISLDKLKFETDSCRPYYYDADEPYFQSNPSAERPLKFSRMELTKDIVKPGDLTNSIRWLCNR